MSVAAIVIAPSAFVIVTLLPAVNTAFSNILFVLSYINTCPAAGFVIVTSVKLFKAASRLKVVLDNDKPVPALYVVFVSVAAIVSVSVLSLVVNVTLLPAAIVKVSVALSATMLFWPLTAIVLKLSVCVSVAAIVNDGYVPVTVTQE